MFGHFWPWTTQVWPPNEQQSRVKSVGARWASDPSRPLVPLGLSIAKLTLFMAVRVTTAHIIRLSLQRPAKCIYRTLRDENNENINLVSSSNTRQNREKRIEGRVYELLRLKSFSDYPFFPTSIPFSSLSFSFSEENFKTFISVCSWVKELRADIPLKIKSWWREAAWASVGF